MPAFYMFGPPNPINQSDIHHRITHFGNFFLQQRHAANITTNVMETFTVINSIYRNRSFWYSSSVSWFSSCNMLLLDWCNDFGQTKRTLFFTCYCYCYCYRYCCCFPIIYWWWCTNAKVAALSSTSSSLKEFIIYLLLLFLLLFHYFACMEMGGEGGGHWSLLIYTLVSK